MPNSYISKAEGFARLRGLRIKPGETIYTVLRHVSASGMSRAIDVVIMRQNKPMRISHLVAAIGHYSLDPRHEGLKVGGAGMDMGFHVVYGLGAMLWPKGTRKPHGTRNGEPDRDGGYALKHQWL